MVRDYSEQIEEIVWNVQGKVQEVRFEAGKPGPSALQYEYDPMGNRLAKKKLYVDGPVDIRSEGQYYVRDPQGNVLAVYDHRDRLANVVNEAGDSLYLEELHLYGSARLGILKKRVTLKEFQKSLELPGDDLGDLLLFKSSAASVVSSYHQLELGRRRYELSNHLGNVLATVSDKSLGQDSSQTGQADYYLAQVSSASLYYPFGWEMPGRKFVSGEGYRFGFNGKEDDRDWGMQNVQDYGFRLYNPSIGKFLSVDPLSPDYPWYTPYQFAGNKPIQAIDLDGLEEHFVNKGTFMSPPSKSNDDNYKNIGYEMLKGPYSIDYLNSQFQPYGGKALDEDEIKNLKLDIELITIHGDSEALGKKRGGHVMWNLKQGRFYGFSMTKEGYFLFPKKGKDNGRYESYTPTTLESSKGIGLEKEWENPMYTTFEIQVNLEQFIKLKDYYYEDTKVQFDKNGDIATIGRIKKTPNYDYSVFIGSKKGSRCCESAVDAGIQAGIFSKKDKIKKFTVGQVIRSLYRKFPSTTTEPGDNRKGENGKEIKYNRSGIPEKE